MRTRIPLPTARSAVPMAAVVLPLPGPVLMRISPRRDSFGMMWRRSAVESVAAVIGVASKDCKCAVELLGQHDPGELMREGHGSEGKQEIGALARLLLPSIRRT